VLRGYGYQLTKDLLTTIVVVFAVAAAAAAAKINKLLYLNYRTMSSFKPIVSNKTLTFYNHKIND